MDWSIFNEIHPTLIERLKLQGFIKPTEVQTQVIRSFKNFKDFIIASQTGSGKTLAFGIPIISEMINNIDYYQRRAKQNKLNCLILTPTRELAIQIMKHLKPLLQQDFYIGCLIGGMSKQKQMRVLNSKLSILIATPGRLWEFIENDQVKCLQDLNSCKYLVIDEADRMVELGHYEDLDKIIERVGNKTKIHVDKEVEDLMKLTSEKFSFTKKGKQFDIEPEEIIEMDYEKFKQMQIGGTEDNEVEFDEEQSNNQNYNKSQVEVVEQQLEEEEEEIQDEKQQIQNYYEEEQESEEDLSNKKKMKTFLVSATLTHQFQKGQKFKFFKENSDNKEIQDMVPKLQSLIGKLKIQNKPKIIDLTQQLIFPEQMKFYQSYVEEEDKLLYLVNYINQQKDQTFIIFSNSITYAKKIQSLLDVLGYKSVCLHSLQQQRQRLKRLDKFINKSIKILICTDVAARGIDIPNVENVIHFQIPFTVDTFVHRCGRTARIGNQGQALCLIGPKDIVRFQKLEKDIQKGGVKINNYSMSFQEQENLKNIIKQAQEVEKEKYQLQKKSKLMDGLKMQLKNSDYDIDDEEVKKELQLVDEEIIKKKRIFEQKNNQYQSILFQKQQPNQKQYNKNRRNALFLTPDQIKDLQSKIQKANQTNQVYQNFKERKNNKFQDKKNRKFQRQQQL